MTISFEPTTGALGAFVHGVKLAEQITEADHQTLQQGLDDHQLLIFRRPEPLQDEDLLRFAQRLGVINVYFHKAIGMPGERKGEVRVISNAAEFGAVGGNEELDWHTNISYQERVAAFTILNAVELPPPGERPATMWSNLRLAYERLDPDLRAIADRSRVHYSQKGYQGNVVIDPTMVIPEAVNSLVKTNPRNGLTSLYEVGRRMTVQVEGMSPEESSTFNEALLEFATQPDFRYVHEWEVGDTIVWDDFSTSHRRDPWKSNARRVMRVIDVLEPAPSGSKPAVPRGQVLPEHLASSR